MGAVECCPHDIFPGDHYTNIALKLVDRVEVAEAHTTRVQGGNSARSVAVHLKSTIECAYG